MYIIINQIPWCFGLLVAQNKMKTWPIRTCCEGHFSFFMLEKEYLMVIKKNVSLVSAVKYAESLGKNRCLFLLVGVFFRYKTFDTLFVCLFTAGDVTETWKHHALLWNPFELKLKETPERSNSPTAHWHETNTSKIRNARLFQITCLNEDMSKIITYQGEINFICLLCSCYIRSSTETQVWSFEAVNDQLSYIDHSESRRRIDWLSDQHKH